MTLTPAQRRALEVLEDGQAWIDDVDVANALVLSGYVLTDGSCGLVFYVITPAGREVLRG